MALHGLKDSQRSTQSFRRSFGWSVLWLVSPFAILLPVSPLAGQSFCHPFAGQSFGWSVNHGQE